MAQTNTSYSEEPLNLSWQYPKGLINLSLTNMLLRILTMGIYHFWAKTEVRKRIWSAIRINNEPLIYTGRGYELLLGFLIVFLFVIMLPILCFYGLTLMLGPKNLILNIAVLLSYIFFGYLIGIAIYRAQRYRLARTTWRGIRGSLEGSPAAYAWIYFWTLLLIPLTLGWIIPWRTTKLQSVITNNIRFGDRALRFDAQSRPLYGSFTMMWFGTIMIYCTFIGFIIALLFPRLRAAQESRILFMPTLEDIIAFIAAFIIAGLLYALVSSWYQARVTNHFANHTHFENATFSGRLSALGLIWLSFSNFLIMLAGLVLVFCIIIGLALPFIEFENLQIPEGRAIAQIIGVLAPFLLFFGFTIFSPITQARTVGYTIRNIQISGTAPIAEIVQSAGANVKYGEGLAEAFDVDGF